MIKKLAFLSLLFFYVNAVFAFNNPDFKILSPDGNYQFHVYQKILKNNTKQLYYQVSFKNKAVILESELGVLIENQLFESALAIENDLSEKWFDNLDFKAVEHSSKNETWKPVYGERSLVKDHYNEMVLKFEKFGNGNSEEEGHAGTSYDRRRSYELEFVIRAYNEGVAFKYHFPENSNGLFMHIVGEDTQFSLPEGTVAYYERWAQGPYSLLPLKNWKDESERPLTLKLTNGLNVALLEAQMVNYVRTKFRLSDKKENTLQASLYNKLDVITPFSTPWRVIMVAEKSGQLLENNDIILNLNPPNEIEDTSWIKPGKVIRSGLTTKEAMACVDFAAAHQLQYVHLDAGWYGPEMKVSSDASRVVEGRDLEMQKIIDYAASKNIGIFIYVNQRALFNQIDKLFPLYQKWGIKGIKFGFVQVGSNRWTHWMHEAVKKAAKYKLMVDIHDEYRPTGFSRTYPNLMTQEGVRGNEEMPDATHNATLPFTRYLAGAGDYTVSYYNNRIKTTHAHQLALSVVYYSPIQFLYWYDNPTMFKNEPEIEFFDKVKTVWDDTKVISGEIGEHIAITRKSKEDWFMGIITNNDSRKLNIPLNFLTKGKKYVAHFYTDDEKMNTKTKVRVSRYIVNSTDKLNFVLKASGGAAIHFEPLENVKDKKIAKLPKGVF
jgi:alpha-glucosidase